MIPKIKLLELVEDYCMGNLSHSERQEFELELLQNPELVKEVEFEKSLQSAITESDIINLREKLKDTSQHENEAIFGLLDGFEDIQQPSNVLSPEELLKMYDSLPKAHIYQHELVADENIHEFYREQNNSLTEEDDFADIDDLLFETDGLEEALLEKDVIQLRETLGRISSSVRENCSTEEIDAYLNCELSDVDLKRFEQELAVNNILQREVNLHRDIERAVLEPDIMSLRNSLERLTQSETSWTVTEEQIEAYINDELTGETLKHFKRELNENSDLKAEVALRRNVDKSISEDDIFTLRNKLQQVKDDLENTEVRSLVPETKISHIAWWRAGVAIAVIVLAFAGILDNGIFTNHSHEEYLMAPQWTPHRSLGTKVEMLYQANDFYTNGAYQEAIALYDKAIAEEENKFVYQFYKASTLHNLAKYREAIPEYSKVVAHGDNMFVEEAEWYRALCYLKLGDNETAKKQLVGIINRNSYFASDAKAVLRKNRFSFK